MTRPPKISDVRPLAGHYDPTGFKVQKLPAPQVRLQSRLINARWSAISWPGKVEFGPEGREHFGALFIVMKVPGFGWSCWNIEWLHDDERERTTVFMWAEEPDSHTSIWQTITAKMRGTFSAPDFTIAGFFVAGIPGFTEYMTEPVWLNVQTGEVIVVDDPSGGGEEPPPTTTDGKADALDATRDEINKLLYALANKWRME